MDTLLIIVVLFVLFAWSRALLRFRDRAISLREFVFWTIIWGGIVVLTIFRKQLNFLSSIGGVQRPVDVLIYGGIVLLFYLTFRLYVKFQSLEQNVTLLVREIAIRGKKQKK